MLRILTTLAALAVAAPVLADTQISYADDAGQPASQIYVKSGKVRFEGAGHAFVLYDASANALTVLMPERKQYLVLNQQSAAQIGAQTQAIQQQSQAANAQAQAAVAQHQGQIDQANAQMQAAMAKMSPQMQAQMQKMMGNQAGTAGMNPLANTGSPQIEMKDLGTSETVAGHSCEDEQLVVSGQPRGTRCVAPIESLGIPSSDLATLKAMKDGVEKLVAQMGPMAQGMSAMMGKGIPIKGQNQHYDPATHKMVTVSETLKSVSTAGVSSDLFQIPAGYTQTSMNEMMAGHGH